jgi:signal transduction histidine kinase
VSGAAVRVVAAAAFVWALRLRARLERVARAEHELRGPVTVLSMAWERLAVVPGASEVARGVEGELARLRAGLEDLVEARGGRRSPGRRCSLLRLARAEVAGWRGVLAPVGREVRFDWRAGAGAVASDRGRLAQALGNLMANAAEHGAGAVEVRGRRVGGAVRVEVRNSVGRGAAGADGSKEGEHGGEAHGRGLAVARAAARELGGRLEVSLDGGEAVAALELPAAAAPAPRAADSDRAVLIWGAGATTDQHGGGGGEARAA